MNTKSPQASFNAAGIFIIKALSAAALVAALTSCTLWTNKAEPFRGGQTGLASWYGKDFNGRPTASGEPFDMYAMTAAHRTLPLGTIVMVTNLDNGRKAKVTINDRGPFVKGRIIDLSYGAAKRLHMVEDGVARVRIEVVGRDKRYVRYIKVAAGGTGPYTVQTGAFEDKRNAKRLKEVLEWRYNGVYIKKARIKGRTYYRVRLGRFDTRKDAYELAKRLVDEGYEAVIMRGE